MKFIVQDSKGYLTAAGFGPGLTFNAATGNVEATRHSSAAVLTWTGSAWSALPAGVLQGSAQVYRNGLALSAGVDYSIASGVVNFVFPTNPSDVVLVTYESF